MIEKPGKEVFKVVCKDCGYEWYTPDDDGYDHCPHCGSKNTKLLLPELDTSVFRVCDEDELDDYCRNCKEEW